jgi:hypothetical protein
MKILEEMQVKLEVMGSKMIDEQFQKRSLNGLPMILMGKRIGDNKFQLSTDELTEDLILRYERLPSKHEKFGKEKVLIAIQFKGN